LAALCGVPKGRVHYRRNGGGGWACVTTQQSNGVEEFAAVPECRYAKLLQVLRRQTLQDRFVNLVFAERSLILSKAEAPQPDHDIHDDAPAGRNGYVLEPRQ
jgi:hypothetical protein